jgi:hypothetical protein
VKRALRLLLPVALAAGCAPSTLSSDAGLPSPFEGEPWAADVVSVVVGEGGGFGASSLPGIVAGPPKGGGDAQGSLDVVSLGRGGVIELRLGLDAVDGPGPDLVVFENAFVGAGLVFSEPGRVSVSSDGATWVDFPCAPDEAAPNGCAGFAPVYLDADPGPDALDVEEAGGDAFDLADVGVARALCARDRPRGRRLRRRRQSGLRPRRDRGGQRRVAPGR